MRRASSLLTTVPSHILVPANDPELEALRQNLAPSLSLCTTIFDPKALLWSFVRKTTTKMFRTMWVYRKTAQAKVSIEVETAHLHSLYIPFFAVSGAPLNQNEDGTYVATICAKSTLDKLLTDPSYQNNWFDPTLKPVFTNDVAQWVLPSCTKLL